jgi:hypothetical protein
MGGNECNAIPGTARLPEIRNQEQSPPVLDTLHPGWSDGEGTTGEIEIRWTPNADGTLRTAIGGVIAY